MSRQVVVRFMTRAGAWLARSARGFAAGLQGAGPAQTKYRMIDGFLIQAKRLNRMHRATVMDLPSYVLVGDGAGRPVSVRLQGPGVAGRDVMMPLPDGTAPSFQPFSGETADDEYTGFPVPVGLGWLFAPYPSYGATHQFRYLMSITGLAPYYEISGSVQPNPDDKDVLTDATDVFAVTQMFSPYALGLSQGIEGGVISIERRGLYLQSVNLRADESDLPGAWRFLPRRKIDASVYESEDPYSILRYPGLSPSGGHYADAQTIETAGSDVLCVAARVFRQYPATWLDYWPRYESDEMPDPAPDLFPYYDREGEQGLAIIRGASDRSFYDPVEGSQFLVAIGDVRVVLPTDLDMEELHPTPVLRLPSYGGRPSIPNYGMFLYPHVARASGGFVTFSVYSTKRDINAYPPGWVELDSDRPRFPLTGLGNPDRALIGQAYALVISTPVESRVLRADWDSADFAMELVGEEVHNTLPVPLLPTAEAGKMLLPWIVGATSVPADDTSYPRIDEAVCLVWEHHYSRRTWEQDEDGYDDIVRGIGGELVLYRSNGSSVTRVVLGDNYAPLFSTLMQKSPEAFGLNQYVGGRYSNLAHIQYAGDGKLVTAVVSTPVPADGAVHEIQCALIDTRDNSIVTAGVIASRSSEEVRCYVSVVQVFKPAAGESPARPAVLLAGVHDPALPEGGGKTYLSHDGGVSWNELLDDRAGTNGVFFLGNTFWRFDNQGPLTVGEQP